MCAITLDPFTQIAAQIQHLNSIGVHLGDEPVWSLSIDDLRVYADIFSNPLEFLHYVEQRKEAFKSNLLQLDDELDHLGLYLQHNHYAKYACDLVASDEKHLQFLGYRAEIDKFFTNRLLDASLPSPLRQRMPARMRDFIDWLQGAEKNLRAAISSHLLDLDGEWRDRIFQFVDAELGQASLQHPRPFSTHGDCRLTIIVWTPRWPRPAQDWLNKHTKTVMLLNNEPDRACIELFYSDDLELLDANWRIIKKSDINVFELAELNKKAEALRQSRLTKAISSSGKIGRNEMCPCGSGKKFKKCCQEK